VLVQLVAALGNFLWAVLASSSSLNTACVVHAEILVGYLESLRARGFLSMMLWGCPPLPGDDYVIYCHPPDQKIPKPERYAVVFLVVIRASSPINLFADAAACGNLYRSAARFQAATMVPGHV
jgi:hypothetical protein